MYYRVQKQISCNKVAQTVEKSKDSRTVVFTLFNNLNHLVATNLLCTLLALTLFFSLKVGNETKHINVQTAVNVHKDT